MLPSTVSNKTGDQKLGNKQPNKDALRVRGFLCVQQPTLIIIVVNTSFFNPKRNINLFLFFFPKVYFLSQPNMLLISYMLYVQLSRGNREGNTTPAPGTTSIPTMHTGLYHRSIYFQPPLESYIYLQMTLKSDWRRVLAKKLCIHVVGKKKKKKKAFSSTVRARACFVTVG